MDPGPFPYVVKPDYRAASNPAGGGLGPGVPLQDKKDSKEAPPETPKAAPKATELDAAGPTKKPTPAQIKEINDHIKRKQYQQAIDKTVAYYGIDMQNVASITYDKTVTDANAKTSEARKIRVGEAVFKLPDAGAGMTASTIIHEVTHANQIKKHVHPNNLPADKSTQEWMAWDAMAYETEVRHADALGVSAERKAENAKSAEGYKSGLTPINRRLYDKGQYFDMRSDSER
jgi:hypothetical protein